MPMKKMMLELEENSWNVAVLEGCMKTIIIDNKDVELMLKIANRTHCVSRVQFFS